jgi:uncharacterized OsmC-like protein
VVVKITLLSEDSIRLAGTDGPLTIEADSAELSYSPFHMLASGLAACILSVLHSWATHAKLAATDLALEVRWSFADQPYRVGRVDLKIIWPGLPESRRAAALRAAGLCPIHSTLTHPTVVEVEVASA